MTVSLQARDNNFALVLEEAGKSLEQGRLPLHLYSDPSIFESEVKNLWPYVWNFLGHETEIPKPGDYVVRNIGPYDSVILIRNEDDKISAFANICAHRGMRICRVDMGNTSHFRCPYHGWTYNDKGKLIGVP